MLVVEDKYERDKRRRLENTCGGDDLEEMWKIRYRLERKVDLSTGRDSQQEETKGRRVIEGKTGRQRRD